ncbi:Hypothetical protein, putative [Bodo saltans]|uniref:Condensin complex subunit 2 n=1 Tax=Bodo saltans TaxID=75058 RepID=A0A0S4KIQ0_BODSA|nr:Hypothetical protein, putative [Bodo saltans]|eukprot:CUI14315.1 Hypothetical protein, putative [Bodo saltans]
MQAPPNRKLIPRTNTTQGTTIASLAAGPTVLIEDSIVFPSQTPGASQVPGRTPRARTILSAEAEEEAIQLTSEGKITAKNAWSIKLLDGINDSISNALANTAGQEDAAQFTKCANLVEGGAKIWTQRVESTAARTNEVKRRLLRNDAGDDDENTEDGAADAGGENGGERKAPKKQRKKERTVAECLSEINLDPVAKAQAAMQSGTVSAQFRAITERFDQGHAQGLLLNNAPMGAVGNLILDVDYAPKTTTTRQSGVGGNRSSRGGAAPHTGHLDDVTASPSRSRRLSTAQLEVEVLSPSQHPAPSEDVELGFDDLDAVDDEEQHLLDPPNQRPSWGSLSAPASSTRRGGRQSANVASSDLTDLMVPNMSQSPIMKEEFGHPHQTETTAPVDSVSSPHRGNQGGASQSQGGVFDDDDIGGGDFGDDYGGDDDGLHDDDDDGNRGGTSSRSASQRSQQYYSSNSRASSSVRDLVSGAAELAFFDSIVGGAGGGEQLAVAADDPNTWFPMSQADAALHHAPSQFGSNLQKIRRETLLQQRSSSTSKDTSSSTQPVRKRSRTEGGVVTIGETINDFIAENEVVALAANDNKLTVARRENLKKVSDDFKPYYYYAYSTKIAREQNLLLPDVDTKGALPWWLPQQAYDVASLFQPFACNAVGWNVLNKRVATAEDAARLVHRPSGALGGVGAANHLNGDDIDEPVGEMPLHVDDGDEFGAGDFDDGLIDDDGDDVAYAAGFDLPRVSLHNDDDEDDSASTALGHFVSAADAAASAAGTSPPQQEGELEIMIRPEMVRALESHHATVPTQVDVVRLRRIMWQQTQRVLKEQAPEMIMIPNHNIGTEAEGSRLRGGRRFGKLKKPHADASALKRPREGEGDDGSDDGASEDDIPIASRTHNDPSAEDFASVPMHRFSDVVASMLPQIPTVSTTGQLSPAFFFFSLLFLANEHGILLDNVPGDVQDIYITGLLNDLTQRPNAAAAAAH